MKPEIKAELLGRLNEIGNAVLDGMAALDAGDLEKYHTCVCKAQSTAERIMKWNIQYLRNGSIPKMDDPNEEMENAREREGLKRNRENGDRLGYEY